jgi:protocatechuate 3,4-dioxygenase beta subunit
LRVGIAVPESGKPEELELRLPVPVALEGRVVDAAGRPVPHASIAFLRSHPVAANLVEETRADAQGRFSVPGFAREDRQVPLRVSAPGEEGEAVEIQVTPRDGPVEVRLP